SWFLRCPRCGGLSVTSCYLVSWSSSFFFQAEDGIRDGHVTGVQTCALPICGASNVVREDAVRKGLLFAGTEGSVYVSFNDGDDRSEERRVGKECRSRWWPEH